MIRVVVLDHNPATCAGVNAILREHAGVVPVGVAADRRALWPLLYRADPDVVVVDDRWLPGIIRRVPALFRGKLADVPGVTMLTAVAAEVTAPGAIRYHVDGEPCESTGTLRAAARPSALLVCASGTGSG